MTNFQFRALNGTFDFHPITKSLLYKDMKENEGAVYEIKRRTKESRNIRRFFEGGLVPLYLFYTGREWHSGVNHDLARDEIKRGFNGDDRINPITGKMEVYGKSTVGELKRITLELEQWLGENYQMPFEAVDSERYLHWRDAVFPYGGPDDYVDYLCELSIIKRPI